MTKFADATLGVTGASGHLGHRVIELLQEAGARHLVAVTRSPDKLAALSTAGVEVAGRLVRRPCILGQRLCGR